MAGLVAAIVGFGTGVATMIKWISSGTFQHAFITTLPIVGVLGTAAFAGVCHHLWMKVGDPSVSYLLATAWLFGGVALFSLVEWLAVGALVPSVLGVVVLLLVPYTLVINARLSIADRRVSRKTCPDCAETVKVDARVCRYCGWRFFPSPATSSVSQKGCPNRPHTSASTEPDLLGE
jgi:hypothetical protein